MSYSSVVVIRVKLCHFFERVKCNLIQRFSDDYGSFQAQSVIVFNIRFFRSIELQF